MTAHFTPREYVLLTGAARIAGVPLARLVSSLAVMWLKDHNDNWVAFEREARKMQT